MRKYLTIFILIFSMFSQFVNANILNNVRNHTQKIEKTTKSFVTVVGVINSFFVGKINNVVESIFTSKSMQEKDNINFEKLENFVFVFNNITKFTYLGLFNSLILGGIFVFFLLFLMRKKAIFPK